MLTTHDVLAMLEAAGWRFEALGDGLKPVLTNAPAGDRLCTRCGHWCRVRDFQTVNSPCRRCLNAYVNRAHNPKRRRKSHGY